MWGFLLYLGAVVVPLLPNPWISSLLRGEAAADEDPPQGILLPCHGHGWADLQVAEGVEAGDGFEEGLLPHVPKIGALG